MNHLLSSPIISLRALTTGLLLAIGCSLCSAQETASNRYDLNRDGTVDISDVLLLVDIILGKEVGDEPTLTPSDTTLTIHAGQTAEVSFTGGVSALLAGSDAPSVAYPIAEDSTVRIHATAVGYAEITVRDRMGSRDYTIGVTVTGTPPTEVEAIDLGLPSGLRWASFNLGATTPDEHGAYYAWGEIEEKDNYGWSTYSHCDGGMATIHDLGIDISGTIYDAARMNWGGSWRMPTHAEAQELVDNCTWRWTTVNGVTGREGTGPNGNTIFLPATGYRAGNSTYSDGIYGSYWTATHVGSLNADGSYSLGAANCYYLSVSRMKTYVDAYYQNEGYNIRAVCE